MTFSIQWKMLSRGTREPITEWATLPAHARYETEEKPMQIIRGWRKARPEPDLRSNHNIYRVEERSDEPES